MPRIESEPGQEHQEAWAYLTRVEAQELVTALEYRAREADDDRDWHHHIADSAGRELTVAVLADLADLDRRVRDESPETITLQLSRVELLALNNALNEVCNGPAAIEQWEFHMRMGVELDVARTLLRRLPALP
jgi:hypothetical protein